MDEYVDYIEQLFAEIRAEYENAVQELKARWGTPDILLELEAKLSALRNQPQ